MGEYKGQGSPPNNTTTINTPYTTAAINMNYFKLLTFPVTLNNKVNIHSIAYSYRINSAENMTWIYRILLITYLLLSIDIGAGQHIQPDYTIPTSKVYLHHRTIELIQHYIYPITIHSLRHIVVPDQSIEKYDNKLILSDIIVHNITFPYQSFNIDFDSGSNDIIVYIHDIHASTTMNWDYIDEYRLIQLHGNAIDNISNTNIAVHINIKSDKHGAPVITVQSIQCEINTLDIHLFGDGSQFFQLISELASPVIKSEVSKHVADTLYNKLSGVLHKLDNVELIKHNIFDLSSIDLYYGLKSMIDGSLTDDSIKLYNDYIDIQLALQFQPNIEHIQYIQAAQHHVIPDSITNNIQYMIGISIDDYIINSLINTLANAGYMTYSLTPYNTPSIISSYMNTNSLSTIVRGINDIYNNRPLEVLIQPIANNLPSIQFHSNHAISANLPVSIGMNVITAQNMSVPLLSCHIQFSTFIDQLSIHTYTIDNTTGDTVQRMTGNITALEFEFIIIDESYDFSNLTRIMYEFIPDILHSVIQPSMNEVMNNGVDIPDIPYIKLINTQLVWINGVMSVFTDFDIHLF